MDVIYNPDHVLQNGKVELINGKLEPPVECPQRADSVLEAVRNAGIGQVSEPEKFGLDPIVSVHDPDYVDFLATIWDRWTEKGRSWDALPLNWVGRGMRHIKPETVDGQLSYYSFDAGTPITAGTWKAVKGSADTALTGAKRVANGARSAFSLCRPPGHHASRDYYGGYCFLNNAAIAGQYLRDNGFGRVVILDVDYHHGNGTQSIFYDRDDVLFVSIHADPLQEFPFFIGHADETGEGKGKGYNLNLPLRRGADWSVYSKALEAAYAKIRDFGAEAVVVSLGVDTYEADPISHFKLKTDDYARIGAGIAALDLPTHIIMEGGYALDAIGRNVVAFLNGFEGR